MANPVRYLEMISALAAAEFLVVAGGTTVVMPRQEIIDMGEEQTETLRAKLAPAVIEHHPQISGLIARYGIKPSVLEELHPQEIETIRKLADIWKKHADDSPESWNGRVLEGPSIEN